MVKTSTFLAGLVTSLAKRMFNTYTIYTDDTGSVYLTEGNDGSWFLGAELVDSKRTVGLIRHWVKVFHHIQYELKKRGLTEIYAIVSDQGRFNFAEFLGFVTTGISFNNKYEVVRKELL